MELNYELIIGILALIIALIAIIIQFREYKKRQIPSYRGAVGENSKTNKALFDLLFNNVGRIIHVDLFSMIHKIPKSIKKEFLTFQFTLIIITKLKLEYMFELLLAIMMIFTTTID